MKINADKLQAIRRYMDLTQAEMAEHLDVSPRTIANWESSGVPLSKEARVVRILGSVISEVDYIESLNDAPPPALSDEEIEELNRRSEEADWAPSWATKNSKSPEARRAYLLQAFSDVDLLLELKSRSLRRGDRASHWNAERMERYQNFVSPQWQDPDYSNLSDEDVRKNKYGLAARPADPNIGFDDLPNEP